MYVVVNNAVRATFLVGMSVIVSASHILSRTANSNVLSLKWPVIG